MKISARWFQVTGALILLQFILGVVVSGASIDPISHEILGFAVHCMAAATLVVAVDSRPSMMSLKVGAGLLTLLLLLQVPLGLAMLGSDSELLSAVHVVNAVAIVGVASYGVIAARRWERTRA